MAKLSRRFIETDYSSSEALRAEDIPYDESTTMTEAVTDASSKLRITSNDTSSGTLQDKIVIGNNTTYSLLDPGGNEQLKIDSDNTVFEAEQIILDSAAINNKYIGLTYTPTNTNNMSLSISYGPSQKKDTDWSITGSQVSWDGLGLDGELEIGDVIIISYARAIVASGTASSFITVVKITNYTASAGNKVICNTSSAPFTVTLPPNPIMGDEVNIIDGGGTFDVNNLTISRNSRKIRGFDEDLIIDTKDDSVSLVYYNSSRGWTVGYEIEQNLFEDLDNHGQWYQGVVKSGVWTLLPV